MKKDILFIFIFIFFTACSYKPQQLNSSSYLVTFKLKNLKFSDTGFLNSDSNYLNLQVFAVGTPILNLKIENSVCVNYICKSKKDFTDEYLSKSYPEELFENILRKKIIFEGKNLEKIKNGFTQKIITKKYDIIYKIENNNIYFKDKINSILVKLEEFQN